MTHCAACDMKSLPNPAVYIQFFFLSQCVVKITHGVGMLHLEAQFGAVLTIRWLLNSRRVAF